MAFTQEFVAQVRAQKARAASDQDTHQISLVASQ
jgi:hypothetical protein